MKQKLLWGLLLAVSICSCKKNKPEQPAVDGKKYDVTYNLSGFTTELSPIGKQTNAVKTNDVNVAGIVDQLHYLVYDSNGKLVHIVNKQSTDANFDKFSDSLPAGTYTVYFLGNKQNLLLLQTDNENKSGYKMPDYLNTADWDLFFKKMTVTVAASPVDQNVNLDRLSSKITFKITDAIPIKTNTISVTIDSVYHAYYIKTMAGAYVNYDPGLSPAQPRSATNIYNIASADRGQVNFTKAFTFVKVAKKHSVTIAAKDGAGTIFASATIGNLDLDPSTNTVLTGNLFSGNANFTVSLNQNWNTPINIDF